MLCAAICALFAATAVADNAPSLAAHVPADTNLFVEVRGLGRLRKIRPLADVDALLGVPVQTAENEPGVAPWLGRIKAVADIGRGELIESYFGEQVAVAAPSWDALREGVLLARVSDRAKIDALFARTRGPVLNMPGDARVCALREDADGLWLASRGDVIVLGPNPAPTAGTMSYFFRVAGLLSSGDDALALDGRSDVQNSTTVSGRLFLRRGGERREPASAADQMIDGLLDQAESVSATFTLSQNTIHIHATGQAAGGRAHLRAPGTTVLHVPDDALATWRFGYDYREAFAAQATSSLSAQVRFLLALADGATPDISLVREFIPTLGPESMLIVGREPASGATHFDLPTVTFATRTSNEAMASAVMTQLTARVADVINFQSRRTNAGTERVVAPRQETHEGVEIETLSVGPFLASVSDCEFFAALELSWCVSDGWLMVSSHPDEVRRIIDANRPDDETKSNDTPVASAPAGAGEMITLRPHATAEMLRNWVRYLRSEHPHVLEDGWWALVKQRRSGARVELGIGTKADANQPGKVMVALTLDGWPASGLVQKGDYIIGVDGQLLSTQDPVADFKRLVQHRKHLDYAVLRVERDGRLRDVRIGIPAGPRGADSDRNPAQMLEPLADLLEGFESATYELTFEDAERFSAEISLQLPERETPQAKAATVMVAPGR